jgi:NADPH:quinone reductase
MLDMAKELFDLVLAGRIVGKPKQNLALEEAVAAHRALESRSTSVRDRAHTVKKI